MSMAFNFFLVIVLVAIPNALELSTWMGVGPWGKRISIGVVRMGPVFCALMNIKPNSASAADAMAFLIIWQTTYIILLMLGTQVVSFLGWGVLRAKNWTPLALLLAFETERYEASL